MIFYCKSLDKLATAVVIVFTIVAVAAVIVAVIVAIAIKLVTAIRVSNSGDTVFEDSDDGNSDSEQAHSATRRIAIDSRARLDKIELRPSGAVRFEWEWGAQRGIRFVGWNAAAILAFFAVIAPAE